MCRLLASLLLVLAALPLEACSDADTAREDKDDGDRDPIELPTGPLTLHGAGPDGADDGEAEGCSGALPSGRQVLCVRQGAAAGGDGSATAPLSTINDALAAARDGDAIQVATGEYLESVRIGNFGPGDCDNAGVDGRNFTIRGGFATDFSTRDASAHPTTVIGDAGAPAFVICVMAGETRVDGFLITTLGENRGFVGSVGGFAGEGGELVVSHNLIYDNRPPGTVDDATFGAGISVDALPPARVQVSDNFVYGNTSGRAAGILTNSRSNGTEAGEVAVLRNRVEDNLSLGTHGGGVYIAGGGEIGFNVIIGNQVTGEVGGGGGWGGGLLADGGEVVVHHNVVMDNSAAAYGSGEFYDEDVTGTVSFELLAGNACGEDPRNSEILVDTGPQGDSRVAFENVTVVGHRCPTMSVGALVVQGGAIASVSASIFWDNLGEGDAPFDFGVDDSGQITVTDTVTQQGHSGSGNVTSDPGFMDVAGGELHSQSYPQRGAFAPGGLLPAP